MTEAARLEAYRKGLLAEIFAAMLLRLKGYRILARRYKTPGGEADLVAQKGDSLVFVEVKARKSLSEALEAVHPRNRYRVYRAALHYLSRHPHLAGADIRFDVIALAPPFSIRHLDNAWQAPT